MSGSEIEKLLAAVRRAERRAKTARSERDEAIRQAKAAGASYGQIAEASGLSRPGVQAVIRRAG